MVKVINFDMDGTIANFYGVEGWLEYLTAEDTTPYEIAKPLVNMNRLAKRLNKMRADGWEINVISWCAKYGTEEFNERTAQVKRKWLNKHLHSVKFDNIYIVPYGTPKESLSVGVLFDDEERNRTNWGENAYDVNEILETLNFLGGLK